MYVPTNVLVTYFPTISQPSRSARARVVRKQSAAPSPTPLALPAVVEPSSANTGLSFASDSSVTPGRTVSSTETTAPRISTGRISSAKMPDWIDWERMSMFFAGSAGCEQYLGGTGVRNECILVLFLPRDIVCLRDLLGRPTHGLECFRQ